MNGMRVKRAANKSAAILIVLALAFSVCLAIALTGGTAIAAAEGERTVYVLQDLLDEDYASRDGSYESPFLRIEDAYDALTSMGGIVAVLKKYEFIDGRAYTLTSNDYVVGGASHRLDEGKRVEIQGHELSKQLFYVGGNSTLSLGGDLVINYVSESAADPINTLISVTEGCTLDIDGLQIVDSPKTYITCNGTLNIRNFSGTMNADITEPIFEFNNYLAYPITFGENVDFGDRFMWPCYLHVYNINMPIRMLAVDADGFDDEGNRITEDIEGRMIANVPGNYTQYTAGIALRYFEMYELDQELYDQGIIELNISKNYAAYVDGEKIIVGKTLNVGFDTNGGSGIEPQYVGINGHVKATNIPVKEGFEFAGWYKDMDTLERPWIYAADTVSTATTLYAKWTVRENSGRTVYVTQSTFNKDGTNYRGADATGDGTYYNPYYSLEKCYTELASIGGMIVVEGSYIFDSNVIEVTITPTYLQIDDKVCTIDDGKSVEFSACLMNKFVFRVYYNQTLNIGGGLTITQIIDGHWEEIIAVIDCDNGILNIDGLSVYNFTGALIDNYRGTVHLSNCYIEFAVPFEDLIYGIDNRGTLSIGENVDIGDYFYYSSRPIVLDGANVPISFAAIPDWADDEDGKTELPPYGRLLASAAEGSSVEDYLHLITLYEPDWDLYNSTEEIVIEVSKNYVAVIDGDYIIIDYLKTVTFDSNGGSAVAPISVQINNPITEPSAPERENFIFDGWYTDNGTFDDRFDFDADITENVTLYAKWLNTVVYVMPGSGNDGNDGGTEETAVASLGRAYQLLKKFGGKILLLNAMDFEGFSEIVISPTYFFNGSTTWSIDSGSVEIYSVPKKSDIESFGVNLRLHGFFHVWDGIKLTLTGGLKLFAPDYASEALIYMSGAELVIDDASFECELAYFIVNNGDNGSAYLRDVKFVSRRMELPLAMMIGQNANQTFNLVIADNVDFGAGQLLCNMTVYVEGSNIKPFNLSRLDAAVGDVLVKTVDGSSALPYLYLITFYNAYLINDEGGNSNGFDIKPLLTVQAVDDKIIVTDTFTVTFDSNGGTDVDPQYVEPDQWVAVPVEPTRIKYDFAGWYLDNGTFELLWDFETPIVTNTTLYAKWVRSDDVRIIVDQKSLTAIYDGKSHSISAFTSNDAPIVYSVTNSFIEPGKYVVTLTVLETDTYNGASLVVTMVIKKTIVPTDPNDSADENNKEGEISVPSGVDPDATLVIKVIDSVTNAALAAPAGNNLYNKYNVTMYIGDIAVSPRGIVIVKFNKPADLNSQTGIKVLYIENGKVVTVVADIDETGVSFAMTELGDFIVVTDTEAAAIAPVGGKIDLLWLVIIFAVITMLEAVALFVIVRNRKKSEDDENNDKGSGDGGNGDAPNTNTAAAQN